MDENNERKQKSEILFKKAMDCYTKKEYGDALKYFQASIKQYPNNREELFKKYAKIIFLKITQKIIPKIKFKLPKIIFIIISKYQE